jgi:hypothetical protein
MARSRGLSSSSVELSLDRAADCPVPQAMRENYLDLGTLTVAVIRDLAAISGCLDNPAAVRVAGSADAP